jgi:hypothetical protein
MLGMILICYINFFTSKSHMIYFADKRLKICRRTTILLMERNVPNDLDQPRPTQIGLRAKFQLNNNFH